MKTRKIKIALVGNWSKALTGFGNNNRNVLIAIHKDPRFEVVEIANGARYGADLRSPWKSYGSYPSDSKTLQEISGDPHKEKLAAYGNYTLDKIIEIEQPDIVLGVEDIWAFDWHKKKWFDKLNTVVWTTLDSLPIIDFAYQLAPKVNKFLVWATFAEKEMKKKGFDVETLHGAIDYSSFYPLKNRSALRTQLNLQDNFVVGFVFKNQLRKSVPNLLDGFRIFKETNPNAKLLLHTDWENSEATWDIPRYIEEKEIDPNDVLATYFCSRCKKYEVAPYKGEGLNCHFCGSQKTLNTKNNLFGATEEQLNEIYNLMDVYCHPFTSGGQELPIQEAKSAGLITLVTEYSCGLDSCYEEDGGIPLKWVEYREPFSQFIKATTLPESIAESLQRVKDMTPEEKERLVKNGKRCIEEKFNTEKIINRLKEIFLELGKTDWDFNFENKLADISFIPEMDTSDGLSEEDWMIDLYKRMFDKNFSKLDVEIIEGAKLLKTEGRGAIYQYLLGVAKEKNQKILEKKHSLEDFFDGPDEKRIALVMPESAGDVLMMNSLITNFKRQYPKHNLYFITRPQYYPLIDDHPDIFRLIPYQEGFDNQLLLEGQGDHKGYFEAAWLPFIKTQRILGGIHGGIDIDGLGVMRELNKNNYDPFLQTR